MAKVTIRRVGIFSFAKLQGIVGAVLGLIIGIIYGLIMMLFGAVMMTSKAEGSGFGALGGVVVGLIMIVAFPILYGAFGFIGGLIGGAVYNLAAGFVGGLEMELEGAGGVDYGAPPPPPRQWSQEPYQQPQGVPR
ncbi:MAG TPA: hypothetical protein VM870_10915 [Pyrinomonadaceae bacterium]|jgi:hypothetical protein|nr:hypothetical protein [Pyrinomonadaceae bacterium]